MGLALVAALAAVSLSARAQDACNAAAQSCCYFSGKNRICPQPCVDAIVKATTCTPPPSQHNQIGDTCDEAMSQCALNAGNPAAAQQCVQGLFNAADDGNDPNGCLKNYAEQVFAQAELSANEGDNGAAQSQYSQAAQVLEKVEAQYPNDYRYVLMRGDSKFETGKLDDALAAYTKALAAKDAQTQGWAHEGRAHVLSLKGDHAKAIDEMDQAVAASPTKEMYGLRAKVYERAGDPRRAQADLERAGVAAAGASGGARGAGGAAPGSGPVRPQGALDPGRMKPHDPQEVVSPSGESPGSTRAQDPPGCVAAVKKCDGLQRAGKTRAAVKCSDAVAKEFSGCLAARFQNGWLWGTLAELERRDQGDAAAAQDWRRADKSYGAALGIEPNDSPSLVNGGLAKFKLGRLDEAVDRLSKGISLAKKPETVAAARFNRGLAYDAKGDVQKALADFDAAYAVTRRATIERGHALAAAGRVDDAAREYQDVIRSEQDPARVGFAKAALEQLR